MVDLMNDGQRYLGSAFNCSWENTDGACLNYKTKEAMNTGTLFMERTSNRLLTYFEKKNHIK